MKNNNKGFSLVELIVVIAIMAILAAVAVVGVSVYIPKAQQANDQQMIADIQKAVDLYANLETPTPGQSGYIVIHKNGGGESGNVSVGGQLDTFLTDSLVSSYGNGYGSELKVAYDKWTGSLAVQDAVSISNSSYIKDPSDLMETVDVLTDALKAFYTGSVEDPQKQANQSVLDVAADTGAYVNAEKFVEWWLNSDLENDDIPTGVFVFPEGTDPMRVLKTQLAAKYAKYKAMVMSTGCDVCISTFGNTEPFNNLADGNAAVAALDLILQQTYGHAKTGGENGSECPVCSTAFERYFTAQGTAKDDAKAYLAMLGKIDDMSETISSNSGFSSDNFYNGEFVGGIVNDYVTEVNAYAAANVNEGDIVISVVVKQDGSVTYKVNVTMD